MVSSKLLAGYNFFGQNCNFWGQNCNFFGQIAIVFYMVLKDFSELQSFATQIWKVEEGAIISITLLMQSSQWDNLPNNGPHLIFVSHISHGVSVKNFKWEEFFHIERERDPCSNLSFHTQCVILHTMCNLTHKCNFTHKRSFSHFSQFYIHSKILHT